MSQANFGACGSFLDRVMGKTRWEHEIWSQINKSKPEKVSRGMFSLWARPTLGPVGAFWTELWAKQDENMKYGPKSKNPSRKRHVGGDLLYRPGQWSLATFRKIPSTGVTNLRAVKKRQPVADFKGSQRIQWKMKNREHFYGRIHKWTSPNTLGEFQRFLWPKIYILKNCYF